MENFIRLTDIYKMRAVRRKDKKKFEIKEIVIDKYGKTVFIIMSGKGFFAKKILVPAEETDTADENRLVFKSFLPYCKQALKKEFFYCMDLFGKSVFSGSEELGRFSDFYFSKEKLTAKAFEVSRSFFEDLIFGRTIIPGFFLADEKGRLYVSDEQVKSGMNNAKGILNNVFGN